MDELFGIDAQARQEGLSQIDRHVLRLEKSKPLLEQIKAAIQVARAGALPKSALAKACAYTLTLRSRLSRFWNIRSRIEQQPGRIIRRHVPIVHQPCQSWPKAGSHAAVQMFPSVPTKKMSSLSVLRETAVTAG